MQYVVGEYLRGGTFSPRKVCSDLYEAKEFANTQMKCGFTVEYNGDTKVRQIKAWARNDTVILEVSRIE